MRRIEISFRSAYWARLAPHAERENIRSIGYQVVDDYDGDIDNYPTWREQRWRHSGNCPDSGFYVATQSSWLDSLAAAGSLNHYVIDDTDGYVEVLAYGFSWREWLWTSGHRDSLTDDSGVVARGEGSD